MHQGHDLHAASALADEWLSRATDRLDDAYLRDEDAAWYDARAGLVAAEGEEGIDI